MKRKIATKDVYKRQAFGFRKHYRVRPGESYETGEYILAVTTKEMCIRDSLWPMLVINDYDKLTLTVGLKYLKEWEPNWAVLLAGASLSIVPIVIVFLIFQKQFMASTMNSGFGGK